MSLFPASAAGVLTECSLKKEFISGSKFLSKPEQQDQAQQHPQRLSQHRPESKCRRLKKLQQSRYLQGKSLLLTPSPIIPPSRASLPVEGNPPGPSKKNRLSVSLAFTEESTIDGFRSLDPSFELLPPNWSCPRIGTGKRVIVRIELTRIFKDLSAAILVRVFQCDWQQSENEILLLPSCGQRLRRGR